VHSGSSLLGPAILTAVDQFTRDCVWLEAGSIPDRNGSRASLPNSITLDHGSEFCSRALEAWVIEHGVQVCFIRPGRPVENAFIESFNGRLQDGCLERGGSLRWKMPGRSWQSSESTASTRLGPAPWRTGHPRHSRSRTG
jgi:transposase InsO family protein